MRALTTASTAGAFALALALAAVLGACGFRPEGGLLADDQDPTGDAADPTDDGSQATIDAGDEPVADATPPFDLGSCPEEYVAVWNAPSRYRMLDPQSWASAAAACKAHAPGDTHLAVFTGQAERDAVGTALVVVGDFRRTWLGVWNGGDGERTVTGEPVYPDTDLDTDEAVSWVRSFNEPFRDDDLDQRFAALCECDGRPSTP